ncbi:hypothetical protein GF420_06115 [candidate division GN15 bacterium]|nr:hypothetical protein [candidate division GN15 bacterium]
MFSSSLSGRGRGILTVCICLLFVCSLSHAQETATTEFFGVGQELAETVRAGIPFEGMTASLDGASIWPGYLFLRWDGTSPTFDGHIEWTSLNHVNYIEGTITETGDFVEIDFTSTKALVEGSAAAGVDYHSVALLRDGELVLLGKWSHGDSRGPFEMTAQPSMAGQQSSLLEGRSIDDILAGQASKKETGKPKIVWQDDALDWKMDGFEYPDGSRFVKLTCSWARDRLADGPSPAEMMIIYTNTDDSPMLCYRYKSHNQWKKHMGELTHIDIYFSESVQYHLPVDPQDNGWVYSTDPAMVKRIINSAEKDAQYVDSDMIIETGIKGLLRGSMLTAHISTKGLTEAWIASGYFMKGEEPPSILEIMNRE